VESLYLFFMQMCVSLNIFFVLTSEDIAIFSNLLSEVGLSGDACVNINRYI
jgi:hypothetical protein